MEGLPKPVSMKRPKHWSEEVEEAYRFQIAGFRDALEYEQFYIDRIERNIDRWPDSGYIKKLRRKDGCYYYYNKTRECSEKDVNRTKLYAY